MASKLGESKDELVQDRPEGKKLMQYCAAVIATLGGLSLGTSLAWTSPAFAYPNITSSDNPDYSFGISKSDQSWVGALMPLGAAFFAFPIGFAIDWIGRKLSMLLLIVPFTVGWALVIWPDSVAMMMAGRFILGIAGGSFAVAAPTYTSEISENSIRGALGSYFQLMITLGILLVNVLGGVDVSVFAISLTCGIIPLIFGVLFFFMPDTPNWYLSKGREEEARKSLAFFRGSDYEYIDAELQDLKDALEKAEREKTTMVQAFQGRAPRIGLVIALSLMLIQQFSGVNAVIFYTANIFQDAGSDIEPTVASIIVAVVQFVMCFVSTLVVDRLGRKILLLSSAGIMCICSLLLGLFFYLKDQDESVKDDIGWLPLLSLCLFITMFSLGFGPIPWMIVAELFLPQTRGFAASVASCFNWILAFLVTKFFQDMSDSIGQGQTFWVFMSILFLGTLFVWFVVKETKGKSFEEIQRDLGGK